MLQMASKAFRRDSTSRMKSLDWEEESRGQSRSRVGEDEGEPYSRLDHVQQPLHHDVAARRMVVLDPTDDLAYSLLKHRVEGLKLRQKSEGRERRRRERVSFDESSEEGK